MNILITGATSLIGAEIAKRFSVNNHLYLVARNPEDLSDLVDSLNKNSGFAQIVKLDLSEGADFAIKDMLGGDSMDLFISVASATSRTRDSRLDAGALSQHVNVDLIAPIEIAEQLLEYSADSEKRQLDVIFISTVLTSLISPDRRVYSAFKTLQFEYLNRLNVDKVRVMLVEIATFISPEKASNRATKLADRIFSGYESGSKKVTFGFSGRVLKGLYYLHPMLYLGLIRVLRMVRKLVNDPIK